MTVANGSSSAHAGRSSAADLTFRCRYDDWVDVLGGRQDPRLLMATGRLRPRGSLRLLAKVPKVFPR